MLGAHHRAKSALKAFQNNCNSLPTCLIMIRPSFWLNTLQYIIDPCVNSFYQLRRTFRPSGDMVNWFWWCTYAFFVIFFYAYICNSLMRVSSDVLSDPAQQGTGANLILIIPAVFFTYIICIFYMHPASRITQEQSF